MLHFFWVKEMEFDFDPREIVGEMKISGLLDFISGLGLALNKEVVLTPENLSKHPYFRFSPNKGIVDYLSQ